MLLLPYNETIQDLFEQYLQEIRGYANLSTTQLGELIGVSRQTINNMEAGRTPINKCTCIALSAIFEGLAERDTMLRLRIEKLLYENYGPAWIETL